MNKHKKKARAYCLLFNSKASGKASLENNRTKPALVRYNTVHLYFYRQPHIVHTKRKHLLSIIPSNLKIFQIFRIRNNLRKMLTINI